MKVSKQFNTVTTLSKSLAFAMFVAFPFIGFYIGMNFQKELDKPFINEVTEVSQPVKACTMEAKICPDGSSVGRIGPNCEFDKCPGE